MIALSVQSYICPGYFQIKRYGVIYVMTEDLSLHIDDSVQDCSISIANTLEI